MNAPPTVLGLVGPLASGKTFVAGEFADLGATVFTADDVNRDLLAPGQSLLAKVAEAFGRDCLRPDGGLDRPALARRIFADEGARLRLEALVHPAMTKELARRAAEAKAAGAPLVVIEAAVLHRMGADRLVDAVVMVTASPEERLRRLMKRDHLDAEEAMRRLRVHDLLGLGDVPSEYVIDTTEGFDATRRQIRELWTRVAGTKASS